jgi:hypothetical protein
MPTLKQTLADQAVQAIPYLFALIVAGLAWLKGRIVLKNQMAEAVVRRVIAAATTAVQAVEQTTVPALKAKAATATLTPGDALIAKNEAVQLAREHLGGNQWIQQAQTILGVADFQKYLADHVEAAVQRLSVDQAPTSVVNVAPAK